MTNEKTPNGAASALSAGFGVDGDEMNIPSEMAEQVRNRMALRREMLAAGVKFTDDTKSDEGIPECESVCDCAEGLRMHGGEGFRSRFMYTHNGWGYVVDVVLVTARELTPNDRVEGRDAASSRRVPSHDGLAGD